MQFLKQLYSLWMMQSKIIMDQPTEFHKVMDDLVNIDVIDEKSTSIICFT